MDQQRQRRKILRYARAKHMHRNVAQMAQRMARWDAAKTAAGCV